MVKHKCIWDLANHVMKINDDIVQLESDSSVSQIRRIIADETVELKPGQLKYFHARMPRNNLSEEPSNWFDNNLFVKGNLMLPRTVISDRTDPIMQIGN